MKTLNADGSTTTTWEDCNNFHTLKENLPPTATIFFYPWLEIPIPPKKEATE